MIKTKIYIQAYRRNIRNACKAEGNRVPQGYTTAIATNGDFVVYSNTAIVGRLKAGEFEPFTKAV